jgi:uncharacterized protein
VSAEYHALVEKVDSFVSAVGAKRQADLACRAGCSGCCQVWLTLSPVEAGQVRAAIEALPAPERAALGERGRRERAREAAGESARCAMLDATDRCSIYAHRPLVCRTQGLPLQYPAGVVPEASVRARTERGEITYCPLNFTQTAPTSSDTLDADRVNQLLAVVNLRYAQAQGLDPAARTALSELAAETT